MERLCEIKDQLVRGIESAIADGLNEVDTHELGEAVDMVKDLSEAMYYCSVVDAMNDSLYPEMMGYNPNRSSVTGRYITKRSTRGYKSDDMQRDRVIREDMRGDDAIHADRRMGYSGSPEHGSNARMGYTEQSPQRYGQAYNDYQIARRHYTASKSPDAREDMNKHANEHLSDTMATIREIWDAAEPEQRKRIKNDLSTLVGEMNV